MRVRQVRRERGRAIHELRAETDIRFVGFVLDDQLRHAFCRRGHLEEDAVGSVERLRTGKGARGIDRVEGLHRGLRAVLLGDDEANEGDVAGGLRTRVRRHHGAEAQGAVDLAVRLLAPRLARGAGFGEVVVEAQRAVREGQRRDRLVLERLVVAVGTVDRDVAADGRGIGEAHEQRHAAVGPVNAARAVHGHAEPSLLGILAGTVDVDGQSARPHLHLARGLGGIEERAAREFARLFIRELDHGRRRERGGENDHKA